MEPLERLGMKWAWYLVVWSGIIGLRASWLERPFLSLAPPHDDCCTGTNGAP